MNYTLDEITRASADLLRKNRVHSTMNGQPFRYTRPAPSTYEQQWLWDSCFHAIALRWLDPAMAWDELRAVVAHAIPDGPDAGMLPHMTYWDGGGEALWNHPNRSFITQPPLVAVAAMAVAAKSPAGEAVGPLRELYPAIAAFHEWMDRRRDPDGDDLVACIHPWEAGWDAAPRFDPAMDNVVANGDYSHDGLRAGRMRLTALCHSYGCDPVALRDAGYFHVESCDFNAVRVADLEALGAMADLLDKPADAARWHARAGAVQRAVAAKMWLPAPVGGLQVADLSGQEEAPLFDGGAQQFNILFGGCATPEMARDLAVQIEAALARTPYVLSTTPPEHPGFDPDRYWRGNVWIQVNWLVWMGLRRYGYTDLAQELARRSIDLVMQHGQHEHFNPFTGQGHGSHPHSWDALVLDMARA
ncbi:MAG TPA: trehalase family glycosidase [Thermoflexales bacterium]|nr:trehalase family glycosidase [Thermoflexales bacterium]HQZ52949.1 trehalase family glycosidase [Thermoflexales bacterium]